MKNCAVFLVFALCFTIQIVNSAKILILFPFPGKSHSIILNTIIRELATKGHELTFVTNYPIGEKFQNYTEILIQPEVDFWTPVKKQFKAENLFELTEITIQDMLHMLSTIGEITTEYALQYPAIQELIHDDTKQFDLLIVEQFYQEAFLALSYKYNAPMIAICTFGFGNFMSKMFGFIAPYSHVPYFLATFSDKMNFIDRVINTYYCLYEYYFREWIYFPKQDRLVKKYFSHIPGLPSVSQMEEKISLMLSNSHTPLLMATPSVPGLVHIGGVHVKDPKPLPDDIQRFFDDAEHGIIYFSLGTQVKSTDIPPEKFDVFLRVFGKLKQRILWKFENEDTSILPKNVMVKKWLPQNDILADPNVKVFITHGGLLGTQEGVHYGVPMLGIPVYNDQHINMNKAAKTGYAISLYFPNITEISLTWALNELLYNPMYLNTARRTSQIFRDRPAKSLDTAMYWIEYIIRYKGAPHIRSSALDLPWYSFYLIDIIASVFAILLLFTILLIYLIKYCYKRKEIENYHKKME